MSFISAARKNTNLISKVSGIKENSGQEDKFTLDDP